MIRIALADISTAACSTRRDAERAAVADALEALLPGASLDHDDHGAPFVVNRPDVTVSVSHSHTLVAVATADDEQSIGVDIENNRRAQLTKVAPRFLDNAERAEAETLSRGLLMAWTAKEAAYKADGGNNVTSLAEITLDTPGFAGATLANSTAKFEIAFFDVGDDTIIAVATEARRHNIIEFVTLYERKVIPRHIEGITTMLRNHKHKNSEQDTSQARFCDQ